MTLTALVLFGLGAATWLLGQVRTPRASSGSAAVAGISVVVPARNEAAALPVLLATLTRLQPAAHEIIVVDDDSQDGTAAVAAAHGATVVRTTPPLGWLGKPWACHTGAEVASGTHLLFLDADTWLAPGAIGVLVQEHDRHGGLLSVQPHHVIGSWGEELSAYPNAVAMMGSGAFAARRPAAAAFGPCLLTTAADYRRVGGHAAVRRDVIEDLRLAQRYHRSGLAVTCLAGGDTVRFRMYPEGWSQLADGWAKNLAAGASAASPLAVAATALWVASHVAVAVAASVGMLNCVVGTRPVPVTPLALWALIAAHQIWLLRRIGTFRPATAIGFPVPLAAFLGIFARSLILTVTRRPIAWRGRPVHPRGEGST